MTEQNWLARYVPSATKECPIRIRVGNVSYYIGIEDAYRLKHTITMAIDDFKEASQNEVKE